MYKIRKKFSQLWTNQSRAPHFSINQIKDMQFSLDSLVSWLDLNLKNTVLLDNKQVFFKPAKHVWFCYTFTDPSVILG